ncbi:HEAT repeat domain-containing protein [Singulisphaera sp. GP187]|uniref:HEAT repeat domain-containing protein n=1 Tax=Singulisphaera sp. GP187 TaxID=1882752 RepID=UPI0020B1329C|nr:HEAT repeat domain-containing protein [Singulisphaera sp. GP187]
MPILIRKMKDPLENIREVAVFELVEQFKFATPAIDQATGKFRQTNNARVASTIPSLIAALKDPIVQARRGAAHCLFSLGDSAEPARRDLAVALADPDDIVRLFAAKAMVLLDPKNQTAFAILMDAFPQVVFDLRALNYAPPAGEAREVILRIGPAAIPLLIKNLANNQNDRNGVNIEIAHLLGWFRGEAVDAIPALAMALSHTQNTNVRQQSAWALGEIGGAVKIDQSPLISALRDPEFMVRSTAVRALGSLPHLDQNAVVALEESRHDKNGEVRAAAETVLQSAR